MFCQIFTQHTYLLQGYGYHTLLWCEDQNVVGQSEAL